jgi:hypothetical protein
MVLGAALAPRLAAQAPVPTPPPAPGAPGAALGAPVAAPPAAGAVPGAPAAAAPGNLFSFLCMTPEQKLACKLCFCNSPLGKLFSGLTRPVVAFSGGLFTDRCAAAQVAADLAKPAESPEGAAARIKADEAEAKARRAAVRYLGTVDCRYWPEAKEGLINALRADRNECVRLEAAWALGRGCCCTRETLEALALTVSGSERDGNPRESSLRVRAAATVALNNCLSSLAEPFDHLAPPPEEIGPPKETPKDRPRNGGQLPDTAALYYKSVQKMPMKKVVENARRALAQASTLSQPMAGAARPNHNGVLDIVAKAFNSPTEAPGQTGPEVTSAAAFEPAQRQTVAPAVHTTPASRVAPAPRVTPAPQSAPVRTAPAAATPVQKVSHAMPAPGKATAPGKVPAEVQQHLSTLQYGLSFEERMKAAETLTNPAWASLPEVANALAAAGRNDPSPVVRAACLRCVARINFNRLPH